MEQSGEIHAFTNELIHESSPYLLQHAHNPVHWFPWGKRALDKAAQEDKLIVVSIGYASCHWCHVMERESFEDRGVALLMNEKFVSIKVDREERPDIDHLFMTAVQMMNLQGGWPLNCIALPDGRPVWGGTYFPRDRWLEILVQVDETYRTDRERTVRFAGELARGIRSAAFLPSGEAPPSAGIPDLSAVIASWSEQFDYASGGMSGAPKFPMPVNLEFLLHAGVVYRDKKLLRFVETTLFHMARGGIYDQAGGGFARYAVDAAWKVPHFEKMLVDNAQLLGLYARATQVFRHPEFGDLIAETAAFLEREMKGEDGLYFSALDADSEGKEGRFYTWDKEELKEILGSGFSLFSEYYHIDPAGLWQNGKYILHRTSGPDEFSAGKALDPGVFRARLREWGTKLMQARETRVRPGVDDKAITTWNALLVSGFAAACRSTGRADYLSTAVVCAESIFERLWDGDRVLYRNFTNGKRTIPGFLPDYAFLISACLDLFELTLDMVWFNRAKRLLEIAREVFFDTGSGLFLYSDPGSGVHISNHTETQDNVIPSSNAVMADNLFRFGHLEGNRELHALAASMTAKIAGFFERYPGGFAAWGRLMLKMKHPFYEIVVVGKQARQILADIAGEYLPGAILAGSVQGGDLAVFRNRFVGDKTHIFVCRDNVCRLPVEKIEDAKRIYHQA